MDCRCNGKELINRQIDNLNELIDIAKKIVRTASDPVSAVTKFLHERPENSSLPGYVIDRVLLEAFDSEEQIPGIVKILAGHVKEITRHRNVIDI